MREFRFETEHPFRAALGIALAFTVTWLAAVGAVMLADRLIHGTTAARLALCEGAAARCAAHVSELAKECK